MRMARIAASVTMSTLGAAAALALCAGTAAAAPTGTTSALETIGQLQAKGNEVVVNRVGTGPMHQCSVTSVRSIDRQPLPSGNQLLGVPNMQRTTTVHVGLTC